MTRNGPAQKWVFDSENRMATETTHGVLVNKNGPVIQMAAQQRELGMIATRNSWRRHWLDWRWRTYR